MVHFSSEQFLPLIWSTLHTAVISRRETTLIMCDMDVATGARLPGGGTSSSDALTEARQCGDLQ